MREIKFNDFEFVKNNMLSSYTIFGEFHPAIWKQDNGEYGIRIIKSINYANGSREWDYFYCDSAGLIISSPRGMAKIYNKKVRIIDIDKAVEAYKNKVTER